MESAMPNIVSSVSAFRPKMQSSRQSPEFHDGSIIKFRRRNPHHLHFSILIGQPEMDLLMSIFSGYLNFGDLDQLLECDFCVGVGVEKVVDR